MNQLFIEPTLAVIKILPGDRVMSQKKPTTNCATNDMQNWA